MSPATAPNAVYKSGPWLASEKKLHGCRFSPNSRTDLNAHAQSCLSGISKGMAIQIAGLGIAPNFQSL